MYFELADPDPNDKDAFIDLATAAANRKPFEISRFRRISPIYNPVSYFATEIKEDIFQCGITRFLSRERLDEALVKKGESTNVVLAILHKYLQGIPVDDELIIVDPYLFKANGPVPDYASYFTAVLGPFARTLKRMRIVTDSRNDQPSTIAALKAAVNASNQGIALTHTSSPDFHDRFWISNSRSSGVVVGSSLNSLGGKYAIVERLDGNDVADIVAALSAKQLV